MTRAPWVPITPRELHGELVLCFPPAGAGASYFAPLGVVSPPGIELLAFQPPGRESRIRETFLTTVPEMALAALAAATQWRGRQLAFFGHSLGALVAFELARVLAPKHLIVSGAPAPVATASLPMRSAQSDSALEDWLVAVDGLPAAIRGDRELVSMLMSRLRVDLRAAESYQPERRPPLGCPITALVGDSDPEASRDRVQGWSVHTTASFRVQAIPGGHDFPRRSAQVVAGAIGAAVAADRAADRAVQLVKG